MTNYARMKPIWETEPPDFINEDGIKWWLEKRLTQHARTPNINGTTLDYQIFILIQPSGYRTTIILDENRDPIFESQDGCSIYDKINMMKIVKERCYDQ